MTTSQPVKIDKIDNFQSQINSQIKDLQKIFDKEIKALLSRHSSTGLLRSGSTIRQWLDLITDNCINGFDTALIFTLNYADHEGILPDELIDSTAEKFQKYERELVEDFRKSPVIEPMLGNARTALQELGSEFDSTIKKKVNNAKLGWVNNKRIYSGNITSPSLTLFNSLCLNHDKLLKNKAPVLKQRFEATYKSLESENPSHWANAVHECRKIFEDLADSLFPVQAKPRNKNGKTIELGKGNYMNRLICYVEDKKNSETYSQVVTTQLEDFIAKLEALIQLTQKGSHATISKENAYSSVAYTYLLVGDILNL